MAMTNNIDSRRYRGLIISITLFLTLIGALLAFTFFTSSLLERNTSLIDETNKVANGAQSVIKDLFDLDNSYGEDTKSPHIQRVLKRLQDNSNMISSALVAIREGGETTSGSGKGNQLPKIDSEVTLAKIQTAQSEWDLLKPKVDAYLVDADNVLVDSSDELTQAVEQAKTSSLLINESLDDLTDDVFLSAQRQAETIRLVQILGVAAILAYFLIFVFFFVRRLRASDAEALVARRETQEIMQTVSTGLFLLDKDLNIGQQHSKALEGIIGTDRLGGENFTNILRGRISDKDLNTTRQFIEQLYNPRVKEKLVDSLNPLHKVMLHNTTAEQANDSRYLDFKFSRVYEGKDIARILVNVNDVSDAVRLEERLEQERAQNDMQIEMLTTILNVEPKIINEFIGNTKQHIEKMNNILKNPGSSQFELEAKLKAIYREMHSLKGEASALKLHSFTNIASEAEDKLYAMQNQSSLSGNDFLPLAVHLDDLLSLSNTIETLGERINQASPASKATSNSPAAVAPVATSVAATPAQPEAPTGFNMSFAKPDSSLETYYQAFAQEIAARQHKQVQLTVTGFNDATVPQKLQPVVKEIAIQLLRNAIVHGIESPRQREANGKPTQGLVSLSAKVAEQQLVLSIQDDGEGINYDSIRNKLVTAGRYSTEEAVGLTENQLLADLFASGFTTRDIADEDGGRGVGLDIIKERVKEAHGQLNVNSEKGKMTQFTIILPIA
ncbi:ATP-binding protein [Psychrobacter arenosus]|uniref:ATP-binding protein n=1 Tax=Psychrobacter arenosus TaxID=256326 RepID=UPI0019195320|nr:ATP-binding protein [Psychrobacter arenosus]